MGLAGGRLTRFTFSPGQDRFPVWSPDDEWIIYNSLAVGGRETLMRRPVNGSGAEEQLAESEGQIFPTSFLPESAGIFVYGNMGDSGDDIGIVRQGEKAVTPLLATAYNETMPEVSPDGRWLAYVSNESGRDEVYVRRFPEIQAGALASV